MAFLCRLSLPNAWEGSKLLPLRVSALSIAVSSAGALLRLRAQPLAFSVSGVLFQPSSSAAWLKMGRAHGCMFLLF